MVSDITTLNPGLNPNNLQIGQIICVPQNSGKMPAQPPIRGISRSELNLSNHLRMLWEQHVYWTRMVMLSMIFGLPDVDYTTNRLLQNPKDVEAAIKPFYGEKVAAQLGELLTNHLEIAGQLVQAMIKDDSAAVDDADKRWHQNADEIAMFLAGINPNWSMKEWQKMLYDHLAMTKDEASDLFNEKFVDSINMFDNVERQALGMADTMTNGIILQFPQYFR